MSMRFFAISMYGITLDRANIGGKLRNMRNWENISHIAFGTIK